MKLASPEQTIRIREKMTLRHAVRNGLDPDERIGGKTSVAAYCREEVIREVIEFSKVTAAQEFEQHAARFGNNLALTWQELCRIELGEEPDGEEEARVVVADNAAFKQAVAMRNASEGLVKSNA